MGQRDSGIGRCGNSGGDARYDFKRDARVDKDLSFFPAPAEYERITTFQSGNRRPSPGLSYDEGVDPLLRKRMITAFLADVYKLGIVAGDVSTGKGRPGSRK